MDLLLEETNGELVVVDYKTDRAANPAEIDAKAEHYRPQLSAYAAALQKVLERPIGRGALLFAATTGTHRRDVKIQMLSDAPSASESGCTSADEAVTAPSRSSIDESQRT